MRNLFIKIDWKSPILNRVKRLTGRGLIIGVMPKWEKEREVINLYEISRMFA